MPLLGLPFFHHQQVLLFTLLICLFQNSATLVWLMIELLKVVKISSNVMNWKILMLWLLIIGKSMVKLFYYL